MDAFANNTFPGATFRGMVFENPKNPDFIRPLPNEGLNTQNKLVYWDLVSGHTICKSLLELLDITLDEFDPDRDQNYHTIARHYGYDPKGVPETKEDDASIEQ